jgi:hypothetical protein
VVEEAAGQVVASVAGGGMIAAARAVAVTVANLIASKSGVPSGAPLFSSG